MERFSGPFEALSKQFAQAAIRPAETRKRLIQSLEILGNKKEERPRKKPRPHAGVSHSTVLCGRRQRKVKTEAPASTAFDNQIRPPWASIIFLQITNPIPVPLSLECFTLPPCR